MIKYTLIAFLLISNTSFSQYVLQGKILEEKTKSPVRYASISITNSTVGMATDEQGNFQIKINPESQHEKLIISSLGFRNKFVSIDSLVQKGNSATVIYLKPFPIVLEDVIVKDSKISPAELLKNAIAAIPKNYSQTPFNMEFYSKIEVKDSAKVHYTVETIVSTYRKGYVPGAANWSKIIQKRESGSNPLPTYHMKGSTKDYFGYFPGFDISLIDQLGSEGKYGKTENGYTVFNPKKSSKMKFAFGESSVFNGDTVIAVNYSDKKKYGGTIYIAVNTLAIVRHTLNFGNGYDIIYKKNADGYYPYLIQSEYSRSQNLKIHNTVYLRDVNKKNVEIIEQNTGPKWPEDVPYNKIYWDANYPK